VIDAQQCLSLAVPLGIIQITFDQQVAHLRATWQFVLFTGKPLKYDFWPGYWTEELHVDSILGRKRREDVPKPLPPEPMAVRLRRGGRTGRFSGLVRTPAQLCRTRLPCRISRLASIGQAV
jgi:hypothetical protein